MRPLELVFLAVLLVAAAALFVSPATRGGFLRRSPHIALTLALVHVFIDEGRWSLFPAYAVAALLAAAATWRLRSEEAEARDRPWLRRVGAVLALVVIVGSAGVAWAFPVFSLPEPTGKYKVGSRWLFLPDSSRQEELTPEPGDTRALAVRIWFPADSVQGTPEPYLEHDVARAIAAAMGFPEFVLSHLPTVTSHSYRRAWLPATPTRFPLILFSHGYGIATESQNSVQMEELASHGFIVASIDHTYEAGAVVFPDGRVMRARLPFDPMRDTVALARSLGAIKALQSAADTAAAWTIIQQMYQDSKALEASSARWVTDTRFVLDRLTAFASPHTGADTLFAGRVRTDSVGLFGMSFGGSTAAGVCQVDARCAAGLNLDGLIYGSAAREALTRPFAFVSSEESQNVHRIFYERANAPSWFFVGKKAKHADWTDFNLAIPVVGQKLGLLGGIDPKRAHALMNAILVPYFDRALRGGPGIDVESLRTRFPELIAESRDGTGRWATPDTLPPSAGR